MKIKLLIFAFLFFIKLGFAQNKVTYSSLNVTKDINSGEVGIAEVTVSCYGNSSTPVNLYIPYLCGDPDGYISYEASNGLMLIPGQSTVLKFKFKKTVSVDTQKVYKFTTNVSCAQEESKMIKITINYKKTSVTTPPTEPSNQSFIGTRKNRDHIYEGEEVELTGNGVGSNISYKWYKDVFDGNGFQVVAGETSFNYNVGKIFKTTRFMREAISNITNNLVSVGYITINVTPVIISNNLINISGNKITGEQPTGGLPDGSFIFRWFFYFSDEMEPIIFEQSFYPGGEEAISRSMVVPNSVYDFMDNLGIDKMYAQRQVITSNKLTSSSATEISSFSNVVIVPNIQQITNNTINLNGSTILGSSPSGGTGVFTYNWYANLVQGEDWALIQGTSKDLNIPDYVYGFAEIPNSELYIYREVKSGNKNSNSNVVRIFPAQPVANNTITLSGQTITGSLPTGGTNSYTYSWMLLGADDPYTFPHTGQSFEITEGLYKYLESYPNATIVRIVKSGNKSSTSNHVTIPPLPEIQNNTITLSGQTIIGSLPTGGMNSYTYSWMLFGADDPYTFPHTGQNFEITEGLYTYLASYPDAFVFRVVNSGNKISRSNVIVIPSKTSSSKMASESFSTDLTVYPNPTSESINFATNFTADKNIEIVLYSEKLGNEKSVYKGKVTPNQVVNWSIPSNYQKGIYFYKILSDNKEYKSGKVIFN